MSRVKRGVTKRARHKKILKMAKGYRGRAKNCFRIAIEKVEKALRSGAGNLLESILLFDRYDQIGEGKVSLAFTLSFRASDRTLTADEVAGYRDAAVVAAARSCGAVLRS